jgi:hypothetical protein
VPGSRAVHRRCGCRPVLRPVLERTAASPPQVGGGHALRHHHAPGFVKQLRASPRPGRKNVSAGGHQRGPFRLATGEADHLLVPAELQVDEPADPELMTDSFRRIDVICKASWDRRRGEPHAATAGLPPGAVGLRGYQQLRRFARRWPGGRAGQSIVLVDRPYSWPGWRRRDPTLSTCPPSSPPGSLSTGTAARTTPPTRSRLPALP